MSALLLTAFALVVATNEICKSHDPMSITKASIEMPLSSNDDRRNEEKPDPLREEVDLAQNKLVKLKTTEILKNCCINKFFLKLDGENL